MASTTTAVVRAQLRQPSIRCYEWEGKPPSEQWSIMPSNTTPGIKWFKYGGGLNFRRVAPVRLLACLAHDARAEMPAGCSTCHPMLVQHGFRLGVWPVTPDHAA